jgi:hypothetical protein
VAATTTIQLLYLQSLRWNFLLSVSVDVASIDTSCSEDHRLWLFVSFCIFSIINYTMMLKSALLWVKNSPFFGYISVQLTFMNG